MQNDKCPRECYSELTGMWTTIGCSTILLVRVQIDTNICVGSYIKQHIT